MTGRMVPNPHWGAAFEEQIELETAPQKYACAVCHQVTPTVVMKNGTITCEEHAND